MIPERCPGKGCFFLVRNKSDELECLGLENSIVICKYIIREEVKKDILQESEDFLLALARDPNKCDIVNAGDLITNLITEIKQLRNEFIKNIKYIKWLDKEYKKEYDQNHKTQQEQWERG